MTDESTRKYSLFPKPLGKVIEPLTRPVFKSQGLTNASLLTDWTGIMGPALAQNTYPERISFPRGKKTEGMLTIAVRNGFATEVQHMHQVILERLATYLGHKAITRISISHTYNETIQSINPEAKIPVLPPDTAALAENIADQELKDALQSFAKTLSKNAT